MPLPRTQNPTPGENIFIVAEIGKNFIQSEHDRPTEEYLHNAKVLIDAAVEAGADAVKFQTHSLEDEQSPMKITSPHFTGADRHSWVRRNTEATPKEFWDAVAAHCQAKKIIFFTTPMSRGAARRIAHIDVPFWKIASGDVQDFILLEELASTKKPIILSTGMVSFHELEETVVFLQGKDTEVAILYCVSQYPCPPDQFNLAMIGELRNRFPNVTIGFSDHSIGDEAALAAIKLGARIIEKHFSLDRTLWGSDHKVSMTPQELERMVREIRSGSFMHIDETPFLGKKNEELEGATNSYRPYFKKKLAAATDLPKGARLSADMIYAMRPGGFLEGLPSERFPDVLGKTVAKPLRKYDPITEDSLSE